MYAFAGTAAVNCAFDYSAPTETVIIKNKKPLGSSPNGFYIF